MVRTHWSYNYHLIDKMGSVAVYLFLPVELDNLGATWFRLIENGKPRL